MNMFIGIDLHGTLLNKQEIIDEKFQGHLKEALEKLKEKARLYVCTGNDLPFVKEVIPPDIFALFDGFILETGCAASDGEKEFVKTPVEIQKLSQELRKDLEKEKFSEVNEFRRRLTTVSLFCNRPKEFAEKVKDFLEKSKYREDFAATYSSVAVDVIPKGWNKFVGMQLVADKNKIIGIADSMNDFDFLLKSDFSFLPSNASKEVIDKLRERGKRVVNIKYAKPEDGVIQSNFPEVEGVIEILEFIFSSTH